MLLRRKRVFWLCQVDCTWSSRSVYSCGDMGAVASSPAPPASESKPSSAFTGLTRLGRSEETTQAESDPEEFSCVMGDVEGSSLRPRARLSKVASWEQLPQSHRGIRLSELWDFYRPCQEWLEDLRWRCDVCLGTGVGRYFLCFNV